MLNSIETLSIWQSSIHSLCLHHYQNWLKEYIRLFLTCQNNQRVFIALNASCYRHPKGGYWWILSFIFKYKFIFGWLPAYAMPCPGTLYELTAYGRQLRGLCSGASFLSDDFCHFQRRRHMEIWEKPLKRALSFLTFDDMVILNHPLEIYSL